MRILHKMTMGMATAFSLTACVDDGSGTGGGASASLADGQVESALTTISMSSRGEYLVTFRRPGWTFGGSLGVRPFRIDTGIKGIDSLGSYTELGFSYAEHGLKSASIRAYDDVPVVLFNVEYRTESPNETSFPRLTKFPNLPNHLSYNGKFSRHSFTEFGADSPWVFFDDDANAFVLSAANHFMNASTQLSGGSLTAGVDPTVTTIPSGFSFQTILVAQPGINAAYETWGRALTRWSGKSLPTSDSVPSLERLGYWTDNGATYYYNYDTAKGYEGTLLSVRDHFEQQGIPLAYMQLDSWWYPKGPNVDWRDKSGGFYEYVADKTLFPNDLGPFRAALGVPFITHSRWIDPASPYRQQYSMSNNVSTDPAFWKAMAEYLSARGVDVYEQDWLNIQALPRTDNLHDQDAFMDNMAHAMAAKGITMQYCLQLPRHVLQGTKYDNLVTSRVSGDRFSREKWADALYGFRLVSALGIWPWTDVFMSSEENNLMMATLSAGMLGVGDAIGTADVANLRRAIRSDGVIVKPDAPLVPLDSTFVNSAKRSDAPSVAATYTDFGGAPAMRASYVWAYTQVGGNRPLTLTPAALGHTGSVFVYNWFRGKGQVQDASAAFTEDLSFSGDGPRSYYIVVPVGPSGIALVGDAGKYVSLGKKRVTRVSDDGVLAVDLVFAPGEGPVTLRGYAPAPPTAVASVGAVGPVTWDAASKSFSVTVSQADGTASLALRQR
ncbi:hypothetical protein LZC95_38810 [Pendulispora brunnea]|uniref:Alpha-galactosidase n=1 Tax=Pendulispora brunnea TaxID=2905690 RepID=A0ABZ2K4B6_9BACT